MLVECVVGCCGWATPEAGTFGCDFLLGEGPFFRFPQFPEAGGHPGVHPPLLDHN